MNICVHYNQLFQETRGEYFVALADDDSLSANFISELAMILEERPRVAAALATQIIVDGTGTVLQEKLGSEEEKRVDKDISNHSD